MKRIVALIFMVCSFGMGRQIEAMDQKIKLLIQAVSSGNDITNEMVEGLDVDSYMLIEKLEQTANALDVAALIGKLKPAQQLIEIYKANINAQHNNGPTAIMFSIQGVLTLLSTPNLAEEKKEQLNKGIFETFEYLLTQNPDLSLTAGDKKINILHFATKLPENHKEYLEELLEYADLEVLTAQTSDGKTPLELAKAVNKNEFAKLLEKKIEALQPEPEVSDEEKLNKLVEAAWNGQDISLFVNDNNINKYTKFKNENLNALSAAAIQGHLDTVKQLVEKGADINSQNTDKYTTLMLIILQTVRADEEANKKLFEVFKYLLTQKPNLSLSDETGYTVFHWAAGISEAKKEYLGDLLKYATLEDLKKENDANNTPEKVALLGKQNQLVQMIQEKIKALTEQPEQPSSGGSNNNEELIKNLTTLKQHLSSLAENL